MNTTSVYRSKLSVVSVTSALDLLTTECTAFVTFKELIDAEGGYVPSLQCKLRNAGRARIARNEVLADFYDAAQISRGDPRRAHRW